MRSSKKTTSKKIEKKMQQHTISARVDQDFFQRVTIWLDKNGLTQTQLLIRAVDAYISQEQVLEAVPPARELLEAAVKFSLKEYASTLEKLK